MEYAEKYPCVQCGYCCTVRACPYGEWDVEKKQCRFLTKEKLCSKYEEIIKDPNSWSSPAFGAGCSSPLFNTVREEKIRNEVRGSKGNSREIHGDHGQESFGDSGGRRQ